MKKFTSVEDVACVPTLIDKVLDLKRSPSASVIGKGKTLGLIFMNPSLRTRMSTQKAALNLGLNTMIMNLDSAGWNIETEEGAVMNGSSQEHIKDAVRVMSSYCDVLGVRSFAQLESQDIDYQEPILKAFIEYASVPVINLESSIRHPLQSLADVVTIKECNIVRPKIAVTWAPHPGRLPQAVTNSFLEWIRHTDAEVTLAHPEGYELAEMFSAGIRTTNVQEEALHQADFVYAKNWSSFSSYGQTPDVTSNWTIDQSKMDMTNNGRFMHCLPIRRNVIATDEVIDTSMVYEQAANREYAAQAVLKSILETDN